MRRAMRRRWLTANRSRPITTWTRRRRFWRWTAISSAREENAAVNIRRFAQGRHVAGKEDAMSRLYAVESLFTLTGMNADHRLRVPPSLMVAVVARMALKILPSGDWDAKLKELSAPAAGL